VKDRCTVIIGKDTRVSGYMFESALEAGLVAAGVDVKLLGPMPTPAVALMTRRQNADAGIVISASHNPYYDNGIKFFSASGSKLPDEIELAIEAELDLSWPACLRIDIGKVQRVVDAAGRYIEFCKATVPEGFSLRGLKIAVDCAHGATYSIAPSVLAELGAEVVPIGVIRMASISTRAWVRRTCAPWRPRCATKGATSASPTMGMGTGSCSWMTGGNGRWRSAPVCDRHAPPAYR
jgi:phosphoglucosamine mutase